MIAATRPPIQVSDAVEVPLRCSSMPRRRISIAAVVLTFSTLNAQQPQFKTGIDLVEVAAVAVDSNGHPVTDLSREEFQIREDGRSVPITTFAIVGSAPRADKPRSRAQSNAQPRLIVLLLDDLTSEPERLINSKRIARRFAQKMTGRDVLGVLTMNDANGGTSTDQATILSRIEALKPAGNTIVPPRGLDTLTSVIAQMARVSHHRKILVYIGNAALFGNTENLLPGMAAVVSAEWTEALRQAAQGGLSVYVIDPGGLTGRAAKYDGSRAFADGTGGVALVNSNFFERNVDQIWDEAGHYYLLAYEVPHSDRKAHTIDVRVTRAGVEVRARKSRGQ